MIAWKGPAVSSAMKLVAYQPLLSCHQSAMSYLVLMCSDQKFQHQSQATSYSHTCAKGTPAKQAPQNMANRYLAAKPLAPSWVFKLMSQLALLVAKEWLKEPSSLLPRAQDHTPMHFSLCSVTDAASVLRTPRTSGPWASPRVVQAFSLVRLPGTGDVARGHKAVLAAFWGHNPNFPFLQYWQQF